MSNWIDGRILFVWIKLGFKHRVFYLKSEDNAEENYPRNIVCLGSEHQYWWNEHQNKNEKGYQEVLWKQKLRM